MEFVVLVVPSHDLSPPHWCPSSLLRPPSLLPQLLLEWGLSPNLPVCLSDQEMYKEEVQVSEHTWVTPLFFAVTVCDGRLSLVSLLLEFGARITCSLDNLEVFVPLSSLCTAWVFSYFFLDVFPCSLWRSCFHSCASPREIMDWCH